MPVNWFVNNMASGMGSIIRTVAGGPITAIFVTPLPPNEELKYPRITPFAYFILTCVIISLALNLFIIGSSVALVAVIIYGYVILFRKIKAFNKLETDVNIQPT